MKQGSMMPEQHSNSSMAILVVDDEKIQRETLASILVERGYQVETALDLPSAVAAMSRRDFDVVLTDFKMPGGGTGLDIARKCGELLPEASVIIMTAYADVPSVIDAMRMGVLDYLTKPLNVPALLLQLARISERREMRMEIKFLRAEVSRVGTEGLLLGESPEIQQIRSIIAQVAESRGTVLITGESGTGKEVVARQIHQSSPQARQRFVAINCAALPEQLLESELFGHKKGAFTGATANKQGLFLVANEGTIFLDEIGDMPKALQAKLLRVLQEREFTPVGDTTPIKVNLRIVAATNRDLTKEVAAGSFRQDLFYRINVVEIKMPPLRARPDDVPILARHFVRKYSGELGKPVSTVAAGVMRQLMTYAWPGNVRELENVIERALILGRNPERIELADLPVEFSTGTQPAVRLDDAIRQYARDHIIRMIRACGGDKKEAARLLDVGLSSLYRKIEELNIAGEIEGNTP